MTFYPTFVNLARSLTDDALKLKDSEGDLQAINAVDA